MRVRELVSIGRSLGAAFQVQPGVSGAHRAASSQHFRRLSPVDSRPRSESPGTSFGSRQRRCRLDFDDEARAVLDFDANGVPDDPDRGSGAASRTGEVGS